MSDVANSQPSAADDRENAQINVDNTTYPQLVRASVSSLPNNCLMRHSIGKQLKGRPTRVAGQPLLPPNHVIPLPPDVTTGSGPANVRERLSTQRVSVKPMRLSPITAKTPITAKVGGSPNSTMPIVGSARRAVGTAGDDMGNGDPLAASSLSVLSASLTNATTTTTTTKKLIMPSAEVALHGTWRSESCPPGLLRHTAKPTESSSTPTTPNQDRSPQRQLGSTTMRSVSGLSTSRSSISSTPQRRQPLTPLWGKDGSVTLPAVLPEEIFLPQDFCADVPRHTQAQLQQVDDMPEEDRTLVAAPVAIVDLVVKVTLMRDNHIVRVLSQLPRRVVKETILSHATNVSPSNPGKLSRLAWIQCVEKLMAMPRQVNITRMPSIVEEDFAAARVTPALRNHVLSLPPPPPPPSSVTLNLTPTNDSLNGFPTSPTDAGLLTPPQPTSPRTPRSPRSTHLTARDRTFLGKLFETYAHGATAEIDVNHFLNTLSFQLSYHKPMKSLAMCFHVFEPNSRAPRYCTRMELDTMVRVFEDEIRKSRRRMANNDANEAGVVLSSDDDNNNNKLEFVLPLSDDAMWDRVLVELKSVVDAQRYDQKGRVDVNSVLTAVKDNVLLDNALNTAMGVSRGPSRRGSRSQLFGASDSALASSASKSGKQQKKRASSTSSTAFASSARGKRSSRSQQSGAGYSTSSSSYVSGAQRKSRVGGSKVTMLLL